MTILETIKGFDIEQMAKFLCDAQYHEIVPKKYSCNALNCYKCKDNLVCFKEWLEKEVKGK